LTAIIISIRIGTTGADDQIIDPVPVDVACCADRAGEGELADDAVEHETCAAIASQARQQAR